MAQDRPDLAAVANVASRSMAVPRLGDEKVLEKVGRYLKRHPVCELRFGWQLMPSEVLVLSDSDWAGCRRRRRSTSGLSVFMGLHPVYFAEAELGAQTAAVAEDLGVKHLCTEFGIDLHLHNRCDSSAARGILHRIGAGRVRHLEVKQLWVQDLVARRSLSVTWVPRHENPADLLTHATSVREFRRLLELMGAVLADK